MNRNPTILITNIIETITENLEKFVATLTKRAFGMPRGENPMKVRLAEKTEFLLETTFPLRDSSRNSHNVRLAIIFRRIFVSTEEERTQFLSRTVASGYLQNHASGTLISSRFYDDKNPRNVIEDLTPAQRTWRACSLDKSVNLSRCFEKNSSLCTLD